MSVNIKTHVRGTERRRKRFIIPIIYFIAEGVVTWLALSLIQLNFDIREWEIWAISIFVIGGIYSIVKTVNVFQRQRDYIEVKDE